MVQNDLPFGEDTAQRLMAIARDEVISNADYSRYLPASWQTLYHLTRLRGELGTEAFKAKIADGTIHPRLQQREAIALRRPPEEPPPIKLPGGVHADCVRLESLAQSWSDNAVASAGPEIVTIGNNCALPFRGVRMVAHARSACIEKSAVFEWYRLRKRGRFGSRRAVDMTAVGGRDADAFSASPRLRH